MAFKRSTFEPHPEGATVGTFADFAEEEGKYGPQTRLSFDTEELMENGQRFRVSYWVTDQFNPRSNSYKFLKAMGVDVDNIADEELEAIELEDFLTRKCQLVIEHVKRTDGTFGAKVANLLPLKRAPRPAAAPAREPVAAGRTTRDAGPFADDGD